MKKVIIYVLGLALVLWARVFMLANLSGGRVLWTSLVLDVVCLSFVMFFLKCFDRMLEEGFRWLFPGTRLLSVCTRNGLRAGIIAIVVLPLLMVLVQLFPQKIGSGLNPAELGMKYEDVKLQVDGMDIAGWHILSPQPEATAIVVVHGINANRGNVLPIAQQLHQRGFELFLLDLRGHGDSSGRRFTVGLKEQAEVAEAFRWMKEQNSDRQVYGLGYSAGAAALYRANVNSSLSSKLVLDSGVYDVEGVVLDSMLGFLGPLRYPAWRLGSLYAYLLAGADFEDRLMELAPRPDTQHLLIFGNKDTTVPPQQSRALAKLLGDKAESWEVANAGHLQAVGHPKYLDKIVSYLSD